MFVIPPAGLYATAGGRFLYHRSIHISIINFSHFFHFYLDSEKICVYKGGEITESLHGAGFK